ncbi:hypothetical protein RhiirB3_450614 [Rhizophagus irregularis]|nr:hypothetical protein RhiirB3_450614 [Rhizophagus irregularis]
MTHLIHTVYIFNNEHETLLDLSLADDDLTLISHADETDNLHSHLSQSSYWRPSSNLKRRVLYPKKACWTFYDSSVTYPLQQNVPGISLSFNPNVNCIPNLRVPTCESCKKPSTRFLFSHLSPLPEEILSVLPHKRRYLSPVFLHCSLGRTPNSNPYSQYKTLTGAMNYSRNVRAHALYSGSLGAFLDLKEGQPTGNGASYDETLRRAAAWLAVNNPYLRPFTNILTSTRHTHVLTDPFPSQDTSKWTLPHLLSTVIPPLALIVVPPTRKATPPPKYSTFAAPVSLEFQP